LEKKSKAILTPFLTHP